MRAACRWCSSSPPGGICGSLGVYDDEEVVDEYRLGYSATTAAEPAFCFVGLRVAAAFGGAARVRWRRRVPHWRHGWGGGGECHACKWRNTAAPWRQPLCRPAPCDRLLGARRGGHVRLCLRRGGAVLHCRCRTTLAGKVVDARPASVGGVGAGRGAAALHSDKRQADAVPRQRRRGGRVGRRAGCRASGAVAVRAAGVPASSGIHTLKRRRVGRRPRRRGRRGEDSEALLQEE